MNKENLFAYYESELRFIREMTKEFARDFPKEAGRLQLDSVPCPDPHVERLIESFAFLTARIQKQMESEFPNFTSSLLSILYPHFQEPVPSMSIARFGIDLDQGLPLTGFEIPRHSRLFAGIG